MVSSPDNPAYGEANATPGGYFPETHWSVIVDAQATQCPETVAALDRLVRAYWKPLYVYVRGTGCDHEHAGDLVQGFFSNLLSRETLRGVSPGTTRFRVFLLVCLKRWLASDARRGGAAKRGGGRSLEPLHKLDSGLIPPAPSEASPAEALDRAWAREVFDRAFAHLEQDAVRRGRAEVFALLRPVLSGAPAAGGFAALGETLGTSTGAARKTVFDWRVRLGEFLRHEVIQTVATPAEAEDELRYLLALL